MKKQNKKTIKTFDWHVQLHFILFVAAFFVAMSSTTIFAMVSQLPENNNFSAYYFYLLGSVLIPLAVVGLSYFIIPKRTTKIENAFWTLIVSFGAMLLFAIFQTFSWYLPFGFNYYSDENSWMFLELFRTAFSLLPVIAYFVYLYYLRNKLSPTKK